MIVNPCWIKLKDHLINLNSVGGFSLVDFDDGAKRCEIIIHYPAANFGVYFDKPEGERMMKIIRRAIGIVQEIE